MTKTDLWLRYYEMCLRNHVEMIRSPDGAAPDAAFPAQAAAFADAAVAAWVTANSPQPSVAAGKPAPMPSGAGRSR